MPTAITKPFIDIDGILTDWVDSERIDYGDVPGFSLFAQAQGDFFYFAMTGTVPIGPNTTFWFNTDQNSATGYQIFGFAGGAEFNMNIKPDGSGALYTGGAGETLVLDNIQLAYSSDHQAIEFAIPKAALGNPGAMDVLYDVNNIQFAPTNYSAQPYVAFDSNVTRTDPTHRIGIVYSETTAAKYFSATAYAQLFMTMQSQAMQAGISFDLLTESDLTNVAKLANYDALVFPSFANVQSSQVDAITNALLQVTKQFGVGLITAGNFMTNDQTGAPLAGDSYARMKLLFDATRVTGGFPADITLTSADATQSVFKTLAAGDVIHSYSQVGWDAFQSVSGTGQTLATETVAGGDTYAAILATQTGGRNVLFSTPGVMADNNLLWQAIDHVAKDPGVQLSLDITRSKAIVASRTDMDLSKYSFDVTTPDGSPGVYDILLPILAQWKQAFDFVGSYYVNIGNDLPNEEFTNWAVSAPYYAQIVAMGNEIGTHSYTHPFDTNALTPAEIEFEFQQSKLLIEQQMSAYLGTPFTVSGAAVPGAPENVATSREIIQYFDYMTGGYSSVGSGYPGAFGFLAPDATSGVYLAPNTSFDFNLVEYKQLGAAGAATAWANEWNQLLANGNTPIVLWPWHDYGPTLVMEDPGVPSPYTLELFTDWIQRAYQAGAEFVTGSDLASRIQSFYHSGVTSTVTGNVVNATVTSAHAGEFALNLSGLGGQVIQNVAGWYAYDQDSLFLPETGGSFTITLGAVADDVTHITALPMRGELLSVSGDGLNLDFSLFGEGDVQIDLGQFGNRIPVVTGATITSLLGDQMELTLNGLGLHAVSLSMVLPAPAGTIAAVAFSADTGASATDLVTAVAAQTITGTLGAPLAAGEVVKLSLDNGATWLAAATDAGAAAFTLAGVTLAGSNTLLARIENATGMPGATFSRGYVLDTAAPAAPGAPDLADASDSGVSATDNLTNIVLPAFAGTGAEPGSTITLLDGTAAIGTGAAAADGSWAVAAATALADGAHAIRATATDLAGNVSALSAALTVTVDTAPPAAPGTPDLLPASDTGRSSTDNITGATALTFKGTAAGLSTVTLFDGATAIGSATATAAGAWTIAAATLAEGVHSITATATDAAGNTGIASAALSVTIDTTVAAPSTPDMTAATDKGASSTDNITNDTTPTFTGTAEAGGTVTLLDGTTVVGTATATALGAWTITTTALAGGDHAIAAVVKDVAGNISAPSAALPVTIDTQAPPPSAAPDLAAASDTGVSDTDNITRIATPTFTGMAEAGATVTLYSGTTKVGTGIAAADGSWSVTTAALGAGARSITTKVTDVAGNTSTASPALVVTIDTSVGTPARPDLVAAFDSGASSTDNLTSIAAPAFTGSAEAGSTVTLFDGTTGIGSAVATGGTWTILASPLADGAHSITARAVDVAGNTSAASTALAVTIDTAAPVAPAFTAGTATTLSGSGEAGAIVTLSDGTATFGTATVGSNGAWKMSFVSSATQRSVTAVETDRAGNASATSFGRALIGTGAADTLAGTAGDELFIGGAGADTFVFGADLGRDIIADFVAGGSAHDIIRFVGNPAFTSFAGVMSHAATVGTGVVIGLDAGNSITLNNVSLSSLTSADFTFA